MKITSYHDGYYDVTLACGCSTGVYVRWLTEPFHLSITVPTDLESSFVHQHSATVIANGVAHFVTGETKHVESYRVNGCAVFLRSTAVWG